MLGFAFEVDADAGVIDEAGGGVELDVANETGARAVGVVSSEDGLKPVRREDQVVVEQGEKFTASEGGAGIIGGGEAGVFLVQNDADDGIGGEGGEPSAGAIGAAVVDENDLVGQSARERGAQRREHRLRVGEAIIERDEKRNLHGGKSLARQADCFARAE